MTDDALSGSVNWIAGVLTGTVATTVAVLAVAALGLLMLAGRLPARRAAGVVLGCFVLFSASTIARDLTAAVQGQATAAALLAPAPRYIPTVPQPAPYDPYAGASVPSDRMAQPGSIQ